MSASAQKDIRVTVISRIWAFSTGTIALSVLFSRSGEDWKAILLTAIIVSGAAMSTIVVWGRSGYRLNDGRLPFKNLEELKRRVENLEEIAAGSNLSWEQSLPQNNPATPNLTQGNLSKPGRSDRS
jgi:hypothetical protein